MCQKTFCPKSTLPVYAVVAVTSKQRKFPPFSLFISLVLISIGATIVFPFINGKIKMGTPQELLRPIVFCGPSGAGKGTQRTYLVGFCLHILYRKSRFVFDIFEYGTFMVERTSSILVSFSYLERFFALSVMST